MCTKLNSPFHQFSTRPVDLGGVSGAHWSRGVFPVSIFPTTGSIRCGGSANTTPSSWPWRTRVLLSQAGACLCCGYSGCPLPRENARLRRSWARRLCRLGGAMGGQPLQLSTRVCSPLPFHTGPPREPREPLHLFFHKPPLSRLRVVGNDRLTAPGTRGACVAVSSAPVWFLAPSHHHPTSMLGFHVGSGAHRGPSNAVSKGRDCVCAARAHTEMERVWSVVVSVGMACVFVGIVRCADGCV